MNILNKNFIRVITSAIFIFSMHIANAAIININSLTNNESNSVSLFLDAGTYDVTQIGIADGGAYNAWNAWNGGQVNGCDVNGENCRNGWLNWFYFSSSEFGEISNWDGNIYSSASLALSNSMATSFTLTSSALVDFYIKDGTNGSLAWDNVGGISLNVGLPATVPESPTWYLLVIGIAGLLIRSFVNSTQKV